MNSDKKNVIVFDVWGGYAHFRKFYTTTSPLSFSIPPRTALCGLLGAIIGLEKENNQYLKHFTIDQLSIAIKIINPIKKTMVAQNLIDTKNALGPGMNLITQRTQINFEYIKSPKYRIYFAHKDEELFQKLKNNLREHKSVYTPVLGLSENIADFKYIGDYKALSESSNNYVLINSVVPLALINVDEQKIFDYESEYFTERLPLEMTNERVVTKFDDILFERTGKPLNLLLKENFYRIEYNNKHIDNIVFIK